MKQTATLSKTEANLVALAANKREQVIELANQEFNKSVQPILTAHGVKDGIAVTLAPEADCVMMTWDDGEPEPVTKKRR